MQLLRHGESKWAFTDQMHPRSLFDGVLGSAPVSPLVWHPEHSVLPSLCLLYYCLVHVPIFALQKYVLNLELLDILQCSMISPESLEI